MLADRVCATPITILHGLKLMATLPQGYEISREEKEISRDDFIAKYSNDDDEVEYVVTFSSTDVFS